MLGQLSGSYTVGNIGDDYVSISSAVSDIQSFGMNGSVELIISNGMYPSFNISSIVPSGNDSLYIRSASNNPDSVSFYYESKILNSERIKIYNISMVNNTIQNFSGLLQVENSKGITFNNCKITDDISLSYTSYNGLVKIKRSEDIAFNYCLASTLMGYGNTFYSFDSYCSFYNDSIFGNFSYMLSQFEFNKSYLKLSDDFSTNAITTMDSCSVIFSGGSNYKSISATNVSNSIFEGAGLMSLKTSNLTNSIFNISVDIHRNSFHPLILHNIFNESIRSSFIYDLKMYKNSFFSEVHLSPNNEAELINNFFYGYTQLRGNGYKLFNNSFGVHSFFLFQSNGDVINNSFNNYSGFVNIRNLSNNNYFSVDFETKSNSTYDSSPSYYNPEYVSSLDLHINNPSLLSRAIELPYLETDFETKSNSTYDSSPSYYNPEYVSSLDLHINNPSLLSRAIELPYLETDFDIDGENRVARTLGADDKCLDLNLVDTIFVECGREFQMYTCMNTDSMGLKWKPGSFLVDSTAILPIVKVDGNTLVWLADSLGNKYDSILFVPSPAFTGENITINRSCGTNLLLSTLVTPNSNVLWKPSELVSDSIGNTTWITLDTNVLITATVDMGVCGIKTDTFNLISDPTPIAHLFYDFNCLEGNFDVYTNCYDSLLIDFGDGNYSEFDEVTHLYEEGGGYQVTLTVWHEGIIEFQSNLIQIEVCNVINESKSSLITLYPNPVTDYLNINISDQELNKSYTILNIGGNIIDEGKFKTKSLVLDLQSYPKGIYLLKIENRFIKFIKA